MRQELRGVWSDTWGGHGAGEEKVGAERPCFCPAGVAALRPGATACPTSSWSASSSLPGALVWVKEFVVTDLQAFHKPRTSELFSSSVTSGRPQRTAPCRQGLEGGRRHGGKEKVESWYSDFFFNIITCSFEFVLFDHKGALKK